MAVDIRDTLNELLVKLFRSINTIEEQAIRTGAYRDLTVNDMHVIEAIGTEDARNMTSVAKSLSVTTGTLTISVNSIVNKSYVQRVRSEEDRRVVLVSLTEKGKQAFAHHKNFHDKMIEAVIDGLNPEEGEVLRKSLGNLMEYFGSLQKK